METCLSIRHIIIGAEGFLGSYLSSKLINPVKIISKYYDQFLLNNNYKNCIFYICADYKNISIIINDLQGMNLNCSNTIILFSSAVIYDNPSQNEYSENDAKFNISNNEYINQIKKNESEFKKLFGRKIIIRLGTLYGSSPYLNATRGIHRMIYFSLINNYIEIMNPELKKSLTSFDDLLSGINTILIHQKSMFDVYNISSFNTTIGDLGNYISNLFDVKIIYKENNAINYDFYLDTRKLKSLGWIPTGTLENLVATITNNFYNIKEIKYDDIIIYKTKHECRVCNSKKLFKIIDLNNNPPPNRLNDKFWKLLNCPLILNGCEDCYHLQLNGILNPIIMYKNYLYLSSTSQTMKTYFKKFVNNVALAGEKVLDIACNDCSLLDCFLEKKCETYGVDPAENIVNKIKKHNIYCGFFDKKAVEYFNIKFDIVTAFNVFAHVDDIYDFLNNIYLVTDEKSNIYIQTSQCNMIQNNEFDTIYHEHLSFFNINSMNLALNKSKFYLNDVKIVDVHGSSYLFHIKQKSLIMNPNDNIIDRCLYEMDSGLFKYETYIKYAKNICLWKDNLINLLKSHNNIIGVGASAKGITILNFINQDLLINNIKINIIIDENPIKINKKIDNLDIDIKEFNYIKTIEHDLTFVLFAWNFKYELINKIKLLRNKNDIFINLFPLEISEIGR